MERIIELINGELNSKALGKELKKLVKKEFGIDYGGCMCNQEERDAFKIFVQELINNK
jgi:hypothetical protein